MLDEGIEQIHNHIVPSSHDVIAKFMGEKPLSIENLMAPDAESVS